MQRRHLFILLAFALFASPLAAQETTERFKGASLTRRAWPCRARR